MLRGTAPPAPALTIVLNWESSALSAPQAFRDNCTAAANMIAATVKNVITVNILVGYGDYNNGQITGLTTSAVGGDLGGHFHTYTALRASMVANAVTSDDTSMLANLPNTTTLQGVTNFFVALANEKAFGYISPTAAPNDGAIGVGTAIGNGNLIGVCLHELTHAMGREPGAAPWEFEKFTAVGTRDFSSSIPGPTAWMSFDNGTTDLADYGTGSDPSDFLNGGVQGPNDPFNEFYGGSTIQSLTTIDIRQIDATGYKVQ